jgi:hypothetical protein
MLLPSLDRVKEPVAGSRRTGHGRLHRTHTNRPFDPSTLEVPVGDSQRTGAGNDHQEPDGTADELAMRPGGERFTRAASELADAAWAVRGFLRRAVSRMAGEWGIRQFLDIGASIPSQRNTHLVAAGAAAGCRVIYTDSDPEVVARARELLAGAPDAAMIRADVREPDRILGHPETRRLIDFTRPVGLLIGGVLAFVADDEDPWGLVRRYVDAAAPGSYLALSHGSGDHASRQTFEAVERAYAGAPIRPTDRTRTEVERFFRGLEIVPPYPGAEPEVTFVGLWGAEDPAAADSDGSRLAYGAVARKP